MRETFRLFLSYPSSARKLAAGIRDLSIKAVNIGPWQKYFELQICMWDDENDRILLDAFADPNQLIFSKQFRPSEADLFIVCLSNRIGDGTIGEICERMEGINGANNFKIFLNDTPPQQRKDGYEKALEEYDRMHAWLKAPFKITSGDTKIPLNYIQTSIVEIADAAELLSALEKALMDAIREKYEKSISLLRTAQTTGGGALPSLNPYPGLMPLTLEYAKCIFGREQNIASIQAAMKAGNRFIMLYGASGVGKSSLVNAGILGRLDSDAKTAVMRPSGQPGQQLAELLQGFLPGVTTLAIKHFPEKQVASLNKALEDYSGLYLFIDQFERLYSAPAKEIEDFQRILVALAAVPRSHVIIAHRVDQKGEWARRPALSSPQGIEWLERPVDHVRIVYLRDVIEGPAIFAGVEGPEAALVDRLIEDFEDQRNATPLLALTLHDLYERSGRTAPMTLAEYERQGGLRGILDRRARQLSEKLAQYGLGEDRLLALFSLIVDVDDEGLPVSKVARRSDVIALFASDTLEDPSEFVEQELVWQLFLRTEERESADTLTLAHEVYFDEWPLLRKWLGENKHQIQQIREIEREALRWDRNWRSPAYLLSPERLEAAQALFAGHPSRFRDSRRTLVSDLLSESDKEAKERRIEDAIFRGEISEVDELLKEGLVAKRPLSDDESFAPFYDAIWGESEGGTAAPQGEVGADAGVLNRANAWVMMARGFTPIHFAALAGRADKIRRLVEVGVDVNIEAAAGSTPLVCAAFAGKREAVELLLQLGADPALRHHPTGFDAAAWASHRGHLEIADLLLNHLGDFSQGLPADVARGLVLAAASAGDAGQLGGFVSRIEASEERSQLLQDALTYAATRSAACAQLLVDAGASPVMQDSDGRVSLVIAAQADDAAILRVLLDKGGADDVDAADKWGRTALAMAAEAGHVDHVSLLIERGADLDAGDDDGRTPLIRAALNGKDAIVKLLVDAGSKLDAADKAGHTALMMAIAGSTESTVRLLLGLGANPHAADKKNSTVLMHAVGQGQEGIVQLLLSDHRADGRIANASGHTPLMAAARKGQYPIVLLLLNALDESERQAVDKKGWTALCHAGYAGHGSIVRLLQEQGASLPLWTEYVVNDGRQDAVSGTPQIEWLRGDRLAASIREPLIASTDKPWPMAPIVGEADEWTVLGREEAATLIEELVRALNRDSQWINSGPVTRVRTFQPLFYPDALLCEAESCGLDGVEGLITFCKSAHGCVLLDGTSQPIHKLNIVGTVDLSRADNVRQFAKFFCTAVQGDESSFTLLESPAELDFTRALTTAEQYQLPIHVGASTPPRESLDQKSWSLESNVSYGNRLFRAEFQVWKSGFVSMTDDQQLMESLPVVAQGFSANARRRFIP